MGSNGQTQETSLEQLKKIQAIHLVDSFQNPYSLVRRDMEKDFIPFCLENQISILAYSPLERGVLTGKYHDKTVIPRGDHRGNKEIFESGYLKIVLEALETLRPLAKKHKATLAQLIINCTISLAQGSQQSLSLKRRTTKNPKDTDQN